MTRALDGAELAGRINEVHADTVVDWNETDIWIDPKACPRSPASSLRPRTWISRSWSR